MQKYLKQKNSQTGFHQENANLCALNLGVSEGTSEWVCVPDIESIAKFYDIVKREFQFDARTSWGKYYADARWLLSKGVRVCYFTQEQYGLVLLGPGVLHGVRANGPG